MLHVALDRSALARSVSSFEEHDNALSGSLIQFCAFSSSTCISAMC